MLTKLKVCDIIVKLSPRELGDSETVIENWTTRDKYKAKKVWIISLIYLREILLKQKVKEQVKKLETDFNSFGR